MFWNYDCIRVLTYPISYANVMVQNNNITGGLAGNLVSGINTMQDTIANLERVADTPLPFAYQAHLRISIWYVLLFVFLY